MCIVHVSWNKAISIAKVQHRCVEPSTIHIEKRGSMHLIIKAVMNHYPFGIQTSRSYIKHECDYRNDGGDDDCGPDDRLLPDDMSELSEVVQDKVLQQLPIFQYSAKLYCSDRRPNR